MKFPGLEKIQMKVDEIVDYYYKIAGLQEFFELLLVVQELVNI